MFQILIAAIVVALISSTNAWADQYSTGKSDLYEDQYPDGVTFDKEGKVFLMYNGGILRKAIEVPVGGEGDIFLVQHNHGKLIMHAFAGGLINAATFLEAEGEVEMKASTAQIYVGIWESREVLTNVSQDNTRSGIVIHTLDGSEVEEVLTTTYSDLRVALEATEKFTDSQDWQIAVLIEGDDEETSLTYYNTTSAYGIAAWGERVIYKVWSDDDQFGKTWGAYPLVKDGEKSVLVLDRFN